MSNVIPVVTKENNNKNKNREESGSPLKVRSVNW